jgi:hypothetical protein
VQQKYIVTLLNWDEIWRSAMENMWCVQNDAIHRSRPVSNPRKVKMQQVS